MIELLGFKYIVVDIAKTFKLGSEPTALVTTASVVADLTLVDPQWKPHESPTRAP